MDYCLYQKQICLVSTLESLIGRVNSLQQKKKNPYRAHIENTVSSNQRTEQASLKVIVRGENTDSELAQKKRLYKRFSTNAMRCILYSHTYQQVFLRLHERFVE